MSATAKPTKPATENGKEPAAPVSKAAQQEAAARERQAQERERALETALSQIRKSQAFPLWRQPLQYQIL